VLDQDGPVVCAVNISSDQVTAPRASAEVRANGTIVSLPMEDMAPRLPREEFRANMIVPPFAGTAVTGDCRNGRDRGNGENR